VIARHLSNTARPPALCGATEEGPESFIYDLRWYQPECANCQTCRALGGAPPGPSMLDRPDPALAELRRFRFRSWQRYWFRSWVNGRPSRLPPRLAAQEP
jgi:hypothetical protein